MRNEKLMWRCAILVPAFVTACAGDIAGGDGDGTTPGSAASPGQPGAPARTGPGTPASGTPAAPGTPVVPGTPGTPGLPPATGPAVAEGSGAIGPAPLRRLNRREYNNAIKDLLGDPSRPADAWTADEALSGFDNDVAGQATTQLEVEQFRAAAEKVAGNAILNLGPLVGCDPVAAGEEPCGATFVDRFAARAYRRPANADEKTRLKTVFDFGRRGGGFAAGVRLVIETVLQSPSFLYRAELGTGPVEGGRVSLTSHEVAARLAFFLTATLPDEPLRAAAAADALRTPDAVEQQARRLMATSDAQAVLASFHHQWLELERLEALSKDPRLFPEFSPRLVASLEAGTRAFARHLYLERDDAPLAELFTAKYVFVEGSTAKTYGLPASTSTTLRKTTVKEPRAGLLTDPALMSALASAIETQPVARGAFVRKRLLCQTIPPPPADMQIEVPKPNPLLTTRERYALHRTSPACSGCHAMLDPIGLAFENYDAIGRYRETEGNKPIDAAGALTGTGANDGPFVGAVELAGRLANSQDLARCLVGTWLTFAFGRTLGPDDEPAVSALSSYLVRPEGRLRELLIAITRSTAFRFRTPIVAQACR